MSFLTKWIGFGCVLAWPLLSPDLTLMASSSGGYIKNFIICRDNFRPFDTRTSHHWSDSSSDMLCL